MLGLLNLQRSASEHMKFTLGDFFTGFAHTEPITQRGDTPCA